MLSTATDNAKLLLLRTDPDLECVQKGDRFIFLRNHSCQQLVPANNYYRKQLSSNSSSRSKTLFRRGTDYGGKVTIYFQSAFKPQAEVKDF